MTFVFDLGNTALKGALFDGEHCVEDVRLAWRPTTPAEELERTLAPMADRHGISSAACVSVVPEATDRLAAAVRNVFDLELVRLTTRSASPLRMAYETPETLGADRLAAAVAAFDLFGKSEDERPRPVVAVDAGTAATIEVVSADGCYLGGTIGPGPGLIRNALAEGTAQLPRARLDVPERGVGRSTEEAMRSGIMHGFMDGVAGALARIARELDGSPFVVATGGWADLLAERLPVIDAVEKRLVLIGVRILLAFADPTTPETV